MTDTNSIYNQLGVSDKVLRFGQEVLAGLSDQFRHIDRVAEFNQAKVIAAMQKNRVNATHFNLSTGYGYDDEGRDNLERVYADCFGTEAALVRPQITCGTHALALALGCNFCVLKIENTAAASVEDIIEPIKNESNHPNPNSK